MENDSRRRTGIGSVSLAGMFCGLILAFACPIVSAQSEPLLRKPAPLFVRNDLGNRRIDLGALRGRVVLLNFWATWCAPCQIEMPRFVEWQTKYKAEGFDVIGISMDDDAAPVQSLLRKRPVNYPVVMGDDRLGLLYGGVLGLPVTWLIDRHGIVRAHYKGDADMKGMETKLRELLDGR